LRFEFYNLFNHPNFFLDSNLANGSFGEHRSATAAKLADRAKFTF